MTTVIHIKNAPKDYKNNPQYVFIGRPSVFGNPYYLDKEENRESVLNDYKEYFYRAIEIEEFKEEILKLKDKTLICYCSPRPCHGHIIAAYLDSL